MKVPLSPADADLRSGTLWLLREVGATYAELARATNLSTTRVRQLVYRYARRLHRRSETTTGKEPFMARLRAAGALAGPSPRTSGGTVTDLRFEPRL